MVDNSTIISLIFLCQIDNRLRLWRFLVPLVYFISAEIIPCQALARKRVLCRLDMITDVFNKLVSYVSMLDFVFSPFTLLRHSRSCHTKCVSPRYAEGDLNKGESVCIDRCVAKFFEVNKKVGEKLQAMGAGAGAAAGATQSAFGSL